ncbi:MAG: DedA family protein [Armatimonadota bacterium]
MFEWIVDTVRSMGLIGVAVLMFLENVFPPVPSELIMPLAGFLTVRGDFSLWAVIAAGALGSLVGQLPLYYLGRTVGPDRLRAWTERHGRWLAISPKEIDQAREWFDRYGGAVVFFARLVPGIRSLVSIPAGTARMHLAPFLLCTAAGTTIWSGVLAWLGTLLGRNYQAVEHYLTPATWVILGGIALWWLYRVITWDSNGDQTAEAGPHASERARQ